MDIITELTRTLQERRQADPENSYVASLYAAGVDRILQKVGEEATEVVIAAKDAAAATTDSGTAGDAVIHEVADLWFHTMVLLVHLGRSPEEVLKLLDKRFGLSGLEEKRSRKR
jgi:phosphoribosyl-ATP pyrophosphohydrolase